jgi:hypothetical protein
MENIKWTIMYHRDHIKTEETGRSILGKSKH